eukprot:XP_001704156.1 Hypothetical protein GL50803_31366 [Giardia lamblia ATCC 50803]
MGGRAKPVRTSWLLAAETALLRHAILAVRRVVQPMMLANAKYVPPDTTNKAMKTPLENVIRVHRVMINVPYADILRSSYALQRIHLMETEPIPNPLILLLATRAGSPRAPSLASPSQPSSSSEGSSASSAGGSSAEAKRRCT